MVAMHLAKETVLIVGLGEIGHTLFALLYETKEKFCSLRLGFGRSKNAHA